MRKSILTTVAAVVCLSSQIMPLQGADGGPWSVDFRFSPPEWQTAICLPDDPQKTLVDRSGELLYHYGQGGREFATRIGVELAGDATWQKQELLPPRVPIVRTIRAAEGLEIVEEAFAVTDLPQPKEPMPPSLLTRIDTGGVNQNWAQPPAGMDASLRNIAVHMGGSEFSNVHWNLIGLRVLSGGALARKVRRRRPLATGIRRP